MRKLRLKEYKKLVQRFVSSESVPTQLCHRPTLPECGWFKPCGTPLREAISVLTGPRKA